jgi:hypothetical protein
LDDPMIQNLVQFTHLEKNVRLPPRHERSNVRGRQDDLVMLTTTPLALIALIALIAEEGRNRSDRST